MTDPGPSARTTIRMFRRGERRGMVGRRHVPADVDQVFISTRRRGRQVDIDRKSCAMNIARVFPAFIAKRCGASQPAPMGLDRIAWSVDGADIKGGPVAESGGPVGPETSDLI